MTSLGSTVLNGDIKVRGTGTGKAGNLNDEKLSFC